MKPGFETISEVIAFAAMREEEARQFYTQLAEQARDPFMKQIFLDFAHEEKAHRDSLESLDPERLEGLFEKVSEPVKDLHQAEEAPDLPAAKDMDFRDALLLAIKREDKSHHLYSLLAEMSDDDTISLLFIGLAKEEARHRLRIQRAYNALYPE
jgi:rubrerythrin